MAERAHWLGIAASATASLALLSGCGSSGDAGSGARPDLVIAESQGPEHVHGLGVIEQDVLLATHTGMWRAPAGSQKAARVGTSRQDVMGFTVVEPTRILGSGHPDLHQEAPPNLGLIESRDRGQTFGSLSLRGKADFHALTAAGRAVYGFDGITGRLLASADGGRTWLQRRVPGPLLSVAASPRRSRRLVASTQDGLWRSSDAGRRWKAVVPRRPAVLVAWAQSGDLYAMDAGGRTISSRDAGASWSAPVGAVGQPAALTADQDDLYVALADSTVLRSADGGRSWRVRVAGSR